MFKRLSYSYNYNAMYLFSKIIRNIKKYNDCTYR